MSEKCRNNNNNNNNSDNPFTSRRTDGSKKRLSEMDSANKYDVAETEDSRKKRCGNAELK